MTVARTQPGLRNRDHVIFLRIGRIDDGQFDLPRVHHVVDRLALDNLHLAFDCGDADQQFAEHHQADAGVQHDDAGPLVEDQMRCQSTARHSPPCTGSAARECAAKANR